MNTKSLETLSYQQLAAIYGKGFVGKSKTTLIELISKQANLTPKTLLEILLEQTEVLRVEYVNACKEHANNEFLRLKNLFKEGKAEFMDLYRYSNFVRRGVVNKKEYYVLTEAGYNMWNKICYIGNGKITKAQMQAEAEKDANLHYQSSIQKLATRLIEHGITETDKNFKIETARIGRNIETTITHSKGITVAYTIIASGEIQRPHYRYLIKHKKQK